MASDETRLPHFIIIGAMKSATTTLQEQLSQQPGIYMSTPKEPNFFSDDDQFSKGMQWYSNLFEPAADGMLLGEASTHYTKLPTYPRTIDRIKDALPNARFIYVMRHPVDRLVSHYIHEWTVGKYKCDIDTAVGKYDEMTAYSRYSMQLEPFFASFGRQAVLPVFFDRLTRCPDEQLERVCRFIGYPEQPRWMEDMGAGNVSSERIRRFPLYDLVVESTLATALRRALVPKSFRNAIKERFQMKTRPVLSDGVRAMLEAEFDRDLAVLGNWLGCELNCANFRAATGERQLDWVG